MGRREKCSDEQFVWVYCVMLGWGICVTCTSKSPKDTTNPTLPSSSHSTARLQSKSSWTSTHLWVVGLVEWDE